MAARRLTDLVVSSDDPEVLAIAQKYSEVVALKRPSELATDEAPAIGYVRHALDTLEAGGRAPYDAVVISQPSSPFTKGEDIDACVALLESAGAAHSAVSVTLIDQLIHPLKLKTIEAGGRLLPYIEEERGRMAAQQLPELYVRNGSVYASRRATIQAGSIIGDVSYGYVMPRARSVDINDEFDWRFAEFIVASGYSD